MSPYVYIIYHEYDELNDVACPDCSESKAYGITGVTSELSMDTPRSVGTFAVKCRACGRTGGYVTFWREDNREDVKARAIESFFYRDVRIDVEIAQVLRELRSRPVVIDSLL